MTRTIGALAVLGLLLVPDWATALGWRRRALVPAAPAYSPPAEVILLPPCLPTIPLAPPVGYAPGLALQPPTVQVSPGSTTAPPADASKDGVKAPAEPGTGNPVRPAGFSTPPAPTPAPPEPAKVVPTVPDRPPVVERAAPAKAAEDDPANRVPKLNLPMENPTFTAPKNPEPKAAVPDAPKAGDPGIMLPQLPPVVPPAAKPEPAMPGRVEPTPPPIVLPQLPPVTPAGGTSESKYRPTTVETPSVAVLPVDGAPAAGAATRKVGFYNYTDRDLNLRVAGSPVKLPAKSYVTADVSPTFTWRLSDRTEETTTVPAGSAGVEVVIK